VVSALGSGLVLLDAEGKIQWINETMKDIVGRDISGMSCEDICSDYTVIASMKSMDYRLRSYRIFSGGVTDTIR